MIDYTVDFTPLQDIIIDHKASLEDLVNECGFTVQNPPINQWGQITHRGPRSLTLASFSRDMWWEREVDQVYVYLAERRYEYALIEDLLTAYQVPEIKMKMDAFSTLCLGTPIIGDLNPLIPHIQNENIGFQPFANCWSKKCPVLVAIFDDEATPRSPHFPFPKQEQITEDNKPHPTPSDLT